jgi:predicted PurR-regulated permease PerM
MWVRKWLLHLLLFLSSLTMIITLVTLVGTFLDGELTLRFAIKILTILAVAGLVFGYELWDLKRDVSKKTKRPRYFAILGTVAVTGMIVASLFVIETPAEQRGMRFDDERVEDLSQIQSEIVSYFQEQEQLPQGMEDLEWGPVREVPTDPETGEQYVYEVRSEYIFALCATFAGENDDARYYGRAYIEPLEVEWKDEYESLNDWSHPSGVYCFDRELSEEWLTQEDVE